MKKFWRKEKKEEKMGSLYGSFYQDCHSRAIDKLLEVREAVKENGDMVALVDHEIKTHIGNLTGFAGVSIPEEDVREVEIMRIMR